jgi:hypothetical protein
VRILALVAISCAIVCSDVRAAEEGWVSLYNGKDVSNWINVNCAPETWTAQGDVIHCTGHPTGALRTPRQYENFILELDWRHLKPAGNSGIFVWGSAIAAPGAPFLRAIEVQVLDNAFNIPGKNQWYTTHGDVFPIWGDTMKPIYKGDGMRCFPIEERSKSSPEWNHYRVVGNNGTLRLSVNGKEVSGGDDIVWRKGYLALESEGSPVEFRNIRLKELPPSGATPENSAPVDEGWRPLYNGVDLRGWRVDSASNKRWSPHDWRLVGEPGAKPLETEKSYTDFELIVDVQPGKSKQAVVRKILLSAANGSQSVALISRPGVWTRNHLRIGEKEVSVSAGADSTQIRPVEILHVAGPRRIGLEGDGGAVEFGNIYLRASPGTTR